MNNAPKLNALTIDVEEYFQVHAFSRWIQPADWDGYPSRVMESTQRLLDILQARDVRATFFIVGWVAEKYPELIQKIADQGHEIGSHSYWHRLVYDQTPSEFAADVESSLEAISRAVPSAAISGYRAPSFSITKETLWAQDILLSYGFKYDSSIFPLTVHDRYGIPDAQRFAHRLQSGLWEIPLSTVAVGRKNIPVAGGGYLRLYPLWLTHLAIQQINKEEQPAIIYLHPWEVDPAQPRVPQASPAARIRHFINIGKVEQRLKWLLHHYDFAPISHVFAKELALDHFEPNVPHLESGSDQSHENYPSHSGRTVLPTPRSRRVVPKTIG